MNHITQKSDKETYILFSKYEASIPLLMQPEWLNAVCGKEMTWDVALARNSEGVIEAVLVFCLKKKYGITQITMPYFTQFTSFWFNEKLAQNIDNQSVVIDFLLKKIPRVTRILLRFHYSIKQDFTFKKNDFQVKSLNTQVIENLMSVAEIHQKLSRDVQRNIKKAEQHFNVIVKNNFDVLYTLANNVFDRQSTKNPIPLSIWQSVHDLVHEKKWGKVYYALDDRNEAHAAVMVVWDAQTLYILASGSTDFGRKYGGMTQLIWQAISDSVGRFERVNFLGSSIPAIQAFNLRFNAENKTYFSIQKFQNKAVGQIFKLLKC
jgi:Acetyltransferase (GNAT) domain